MCLLARVREARLDAGGQSQAAAQVPAPRNKQGPGCEPPAPLRAGATEEPLFAARRGSLNPEGPSHCARAGHTFGDRQP